MLKKLRLVSIQCIVFCTDLAMFATDKETQSLHRPPLPTKLIKRLYANFTQQTGIRSIALKVKKKSCSERTATRANSPADVFITVDASRLAKADDLGLFAPVQSKLLESRILCQFAQ